MPYLGASTITCKVGKKEAGTLSSCKVHGCVCEQEWRLSHLFPLERFESASHPFNLIFNSKWVPELHGFQWEMKRVSVSLLNEKESSPKSGH